uniref:Uncharacterized protein n=1 Tax=Arundo donax TaxID=35708 RepID=A0A0A9HQJ8_ARUDO
MHTRCICRGGHWWGIYMSMYTHQKTHIMLLHKQVLYVGLAGIHC